MEEGSSKSFELLSCYHCYIPALAPESLWCASGAPVLSYSIKPVSFKYISSTFSHLYSLSRETRQNVQKNRSPRIHRHSQKTEKRNAKASVRLTVAGNSLISKTRAHWKVGSRKVTSCIPLIVIVRSHEEAKSPHPTYALSSYFGHGPLA